MIPLPVASRLAWLIIRLNPPVLAPFAGERGTGSVGFFHAFQPCSSPASLAAVTRPRAPVHGSNRVPPTTVTSSLATPSSMLGSASVAPRFAVANRCLPSGCRHVRWREDCSRGFGDFGKPEL